ncbi:MAG: response regulator [Coprobacillus sp.]
MYTMIVADDEYELRRAIIETVCWEEIGFKIIGEAENGIEALELVETLEPDILLTDIKMPFITGIDLARKVREIRPAMQIVFLSGYDDFSYAQQAIQYNIIKYLLKPISKEEITNEFKSIKEKMDSISEIFNVNNDTDVIQLQVEHFLMSLLLDREYSVPYSLAYEDELNQKSIDLNLRESIQDKSNYMVMVTRFFEGENNTTQMKHLYAIDTIAKKYLRCGSFYSHGKIVSLVIGMNWAIEKYKDIVAHEIVQTTKRTVNQDCYIGISSTVDVLSKTYVSYSEACNALEYGNGMNRNVCYIEDIERKNTLSYDYVQKVTSHLEQLLKTSQEEDIEKYISGVFVEIIDQNASRSDIDLLIMHMISITCTLVHSLCDDNSANDSFNQASQTSEILSKHSFNEKRKDIIDFCVRCKDLINKQKRMNSEVICDQIMEIINKDYGNENLSLPLVGEQLHISASYLSSVIKKGIGESFVSVLTKKRMEIAKELVLYSSSKLLEISNQCGYSDQHYFSYCFKRYYGLSPNKMREQKTL